MLPWSSDDNPYIRLLAESLRPLGFHVVGVPVRRLFVLSLFRRGADVVHFHWLSPFYVGGSRGRMMVKSGLFLAQILALKALGVGLVWTVHNLAPHESEDPLVERWLQRAFARLVNVLIIHGESVEAAVRTEFRLKPHARVVVIRHGHYATAYPADGVAGKQEARVRLDLPLDGTILLALGRIRAYKGLVDLVATLRFLRPTGTRLVVAGEADPPEMLDALRLAIDDDVGLVELRPSLVPPTLVEIYMRAADLVVLPYQRVFTSGSLMLASTFAVPCVVPASGSVPDYVDLSCAVLYDPDAAHGLRNALAWAVEHHAELPAMGARARRRALTYDWHSIACATSEVYLAAVYSAARDRISPTAVPNEPGADTDDPRFVQ